METLRIPCVLMRGGTSRGLVFRREHLPPDRALWDALFLAAIGAPDVRQLDGVGAGDSHTSKVAVVNPSEAPGADLDYFFGEVGITEARVDYAGSSGNIIAALGLFAVEEGLVAPEGPGADAVTVRVRNVNTDKLTEVRVPLVDGRPAEEGDFAIDGVPGVGPRIEMISPRPEGAVTGRLLPTGRTLETLDVPGLGALEATLLDAANPVVLVAGEALGIAPSTPLGELNADSALLGTLQRLRAEASVAMGLVSRAEDAWSHSNMVPFPVLLFPPAAYARFDAPEVRLAPEQMDVCARVISLGRVHKSINVTVSVALTSAALLPGTLAHRISGGRAAGGFLRIGHPSGIVETRGELLSAADGEPPGIAWVGLSRTARRIMQGEVLIQPYKLRWVQAQIAARP